MIFIVKLIELIQEYKLALVWLLTNKMAYESETTTSPSTTTGTKWSGFNFSNSENNR